MGLHLSSGGNTGSPRTSVARLGPVGLVLMGLLFVGAGGGLTGYGLHIIFKNNSAQKTYLPVQAVVVSSSVKTISGNSPDDNDTYEPKIKYSYVVAGRQYSHDCYAYGSGGSADGFAQRAVAAHQPGSATTVYYNPSDPQDAVLSFTDGSLAPFMMLFGQPFMLAGVAMMAQALALSIKRRQLRKFSSSPQRMPWAIPTWGKMIRRTKGPAVLSARPVALYAALAGPIGYGVACFVSIFALASLLPEKVYQLQAILGAMVIAGCVGLAAMPATLILLPRRASELVLGLTVKLTTYRRKVEIPQDDLKSWRLRDVGGIAGNGGYLVLEAVQVDGVYHPMHAFKWLADKDAVLSVARKVQQEFATVTNSVAEVDIIAEADAAGTHPPPNSPAEPVCSVGPSTDRVRYIRQTYSDLM